MAADSGCSSRYCKYVFGAISSANWSKAHSVYVKASITTIGVVWDGRRTLFPCWLGRCDCASIVYSDFGWLLIAMPSARLSINDAGRLLISLLFLKSVLPTHARTTDMRFLVNVPVLSEQMVVALPMVSQAAKTLYNKQTYLEPIEATLMIIYLELQIQTAQDCCLSASFSPKKQVQWWQQVEGLRG